MNKVKEIGEVEEKEYIGIGSLWKHNNTYFMLVRPRDEEACLIELMGGNRWATAIRVNNARDINKNEWDRITGCHHSEDFTRVHAIEIRSEDG